MRNGQRVVIEGKIGTYIKILPSGKMLVKFGKEQVSVELDKIKAAERLSDHWFFAWMR